MATALQQQLAAISAKSTDQLNLKAQKQRHAKSLLFQPHEAASQSFYNLYHIIAEGFDDLCQLDARFRPFAKNLFAPTSVEIEREHLTKTENEQLDTIIEQFLALVCPRLLLRPAQKSVEWLVRRWKVHNYNASSLLFAFLPYHTHDLFPAVLSLLSKDLSPIWGFLRPYIAGSQAPPRHAIVAAAISTPAFTTEYSKFVLDAAKRGYYSSAVIGFWASVMAQAVNGMLDGSQSGRPAVRRQRIVDSLTRILPILHSALSVTGVEELYMASCMIMTIVTTKAYLDDRVLDAMMEAVARAWTTSTFEDGLLCLALLAEDKNELQLPGVVITALTANASTGDALRRIAECHRVSRLALLAALSLIKSSDANKSADILASLCEHSMMKQRDRDSLVRELLTGVSDDTRPHDFKDSCRVILGRLGRDSKWIAEIEHFASDAGIKITDLELAPRADSPSSATLVIDETVKDMRSKDNQEIEQLLRSSPAASASPVSFLSPEHAAAASKYMFIFEAVFADQAQVERIFILPSLCKSTASTRPEYLSLLAYIWTVSKKAAVRAEALHEAATLLAADDDARVDYQTLLPYTLAALGDVVPAVRRPARELLQELYRQFAATGKSQWTWWKDALPPGDAVYTLDPQDVHKLLSVAVMPVLEECLLDSSLIGRNLAVQLNESALKSALRADVCCYLAAHAFATSSTPTATFLFQILGRTGKIGSQARTKVLVAHLRALFKTSPSASEVARYSAALRVLSHRTPDEVEVLQLGIANGNANIAALATKRLTDVYDFMKPQLQLSVADFLLDLSVQASPIDGVNPSGIHALEAFRNLTLDSDVLAHLLEKLPTSTSLTDAERPTKRRRTSKTPADQPHQVDQAIIEVALRRITVVLELVESATAHVKTAPCAKLLTGLFHLLSEMSRWRVLTDSDLTYLQTVLLDNLLAVVSSISIDSAADVNRSTIRTDLIVEALRTTNSLQVHNTALLLISKLATIVPDTVLHSVMPLFTFMSSNTLRQADQYSSHVISMTVESIVPPLAASLRKKGQNLVTGAAELLLSFTAAFEHMPLHRRLSTFRLLTKTLGPDEVLFAVLAMLFERYSEDSTLNAFVHQLCDGFSVTTQLSTIRQYLDLVVDATKPNSSLAATILGFGEKTTEQRFESVKVLLRGIHPVLSNVTLHKKLATELRKGDESAKALRLIYGEILERLVALPRTPITKGSINISSPDILEANAALLRALLDLMPTGDFITSSASLMQSGSEQVRTQVFASLTTRVHAANQGDVSLRKVFVEALPNCTAFLIPSQPVSVRHAALECVDGIVEKYGKVEKTSCAFAVEAVAGPAALQSDNDSLKIRSLLSLATMVESLGEAMIGAVPDILDLALSHLNTCRARNGKDDTATYSRMRDAVFSFLNALLDHLPFVITTSTLSMAMKSCAEDVAMSASPDLPWTFQQFRTLSARKLDLPILIPSLASNFDIVASKLNFQATSYLASVFRQAVASHTKTNIAKHVQEIFALLLQVFDMGRQHARQGSDNVWNTSAPELASTIAMDVTLRLNDMTLRPFYAQLMEWAIDALPRTDNIGRLHRGIAVMMFAGRMFEQLGSIVTGYADYVLNFAVSVMQSTNADTGAQQLLSTTLRALEANFRHDQDEFWATPQHFDAMREPLVNLLTTATPAVNSIPVIASFAFSVASSGDHLKTLNSQILALFRHNSADVRLAAVKCERAITERLTFDWLNLLPEMLPMVSEALEDDDERVEREVNEWVLQIESITGEGLEGMLA